MRHAKAANEGSGGGDHSRPLNDRGQEAAHAMGDYMKQHNLLPQKVFYSDAARTRETLKHMQEGLGNRFDAIASSDLYLASPGELLAFINQIPDNHSSSLILGHNPGMHMISCQLSGDGEQYKLVKLNEKFPTATLAVIKFPNDSWQDIIPGDGTLTLYLRPEDLRS